MPAVSKAQQAIFGMAHAVRKGKMKRSEVNQEVLDIVDSDMTDKQIKDFASTSLKSLKESLLDALDGKKMDDMVANAKRADIINTRKRLHSRKPDGSRDILGNALKQGDKVIFHFGFDVQICTLIERDGDKGWITDITKKEAADIFGIELNKINNWFGTANGCIIISNNAIICKVNNINRVG